MASAPVDKLDALVLRFYEATTEPRLWRQILQEMAELLRADSAALFSNPAALGLGIHYSERLDGLIDWAMRQGPELHNPRPQRALQRARPGQAVTESELFSDWELRHQPFNAGMIDEVGLRWDAGGHVGDVSGQPIFLTVQRERRRESFGRDELSQLEALLPHVKRVALLSMSATHAKTQGMLEAFGCMGLGAIALDFRGRVIDMNAAAAALMGDGVKVERSTLAVQDRDSDRDLQSLIARSLSPFTIEKQLGLQVVAIARPFGRPLIAQLLPLLGSTNNFLSRAKAILLLTDPDAGNQPGEAALKVMFKLTPSEMRVALGIAAGMDLAEIAQQHGIELGTARVHLRSVMAKTDTHRQTELALLLTRLCTLRTATRA